MTGDSNKAELEIDMGGDAVEQIRQLANEVERLADAEERASREAQRRNRVISGLARQRVQEERRATQEAERNERQRSRVQSSLARQRIQEEERVARERRNRQLTEMQVAGRRILEQEREERIRQRMAAMTPRTPVTGLAGLAGRAESALGMPAGSMSGIVSRANGMIGPAAGAALMATAGRFAVGGATTVADQLQHGSPHADEFTRTREVMGNLPFAREFFGVKDLVTGRAQQVNRVNRSAIEAATRAPVQYEAFQARMEFEREQRVALMNASSVRQYALSAAPTGPRSTVGQQQQYQLAQRLVPLENQRAEAATARAEAENEVTAAQERQKKIIEERKTVQERIERTYEGGRRLAAAGRMEVGDPEYLRRLKSIGLDTERVEQLDRMELAARQDVKQRSEVVANARYRESISAATVERGRLADLQGREQTAASQSARLMLLGAEGRASGEYALRAAKAYGLSNLSQDMMSAGMAYAPETFQKMAEQEGQRFVGDARRAGAGEEYRDNLPGIRREVDRVATNLRDLDQRNREVARDDLVQIAETGGDAAGERIADAIERVLKRIENTVVERMKVEGGNQGYNPPRG